MSWLPGTEPARKEARVNPPGFPARCATVWGRRSPFPVRWSRVTSLRMETTPAPSRSREGHNLRRTPRCAGCGYFIGNRGSQVQVLPARLVRAVAQFGRALVSKARCRPDLGGISQLNRRTSRCAGGRLLQGSNPRAGSARLARIAQLAGLLRTPTRSREGHRHSVPGAQERSSSPCKRVVAGSSPVARRESGVAQSAEHLRSPHRLDLGHAPRRGSSSPNNERSLFHGQVQSGRHQDRSPVPGRY